MSYSEIKLCRNFFSMTVYFYFYYSIFTFSGHFLYSKQHYADLVLVEYGKRHHLNWLVRLFESGECWNYCFIMKGCQMSHRGIPVTLILLSGASVVTYRIYIIYECVQKNGYEQLIFSWPYFSSQGNSAQKWDWNSDTI